MKIEKLIRELEEWKSKGVKTVDFTINGYDFASLVISITNQQKKKKKDDISYYQETVIKKQD